MTFAIVGCGYIADSYRACLPYHASTLALAGIYDRDASRLAASVATWGDRAYASLDELLADPAVRIVVNLTDPESHVGVTRAALAAGKHVYTEKPLALTYADASDLAGFARSQGLRLAAAPCNLLGECAQTLWKAVRSGIAGPIRLVYAEMDDGLIHRADHAAWTSRSGKPWPARGEFATGCTFEHAGYTLTVLAALFGPVRRVTAFSRLVFPDKHMTPPLDNPAPDFSVGLLEFDDGVVARLTNSVAAFYDHRLRLTGEAGTLEVREPWDYASPVVFRTQPTDRLGRILERRLGFVPGRSVPPARRPTFRRKRGLASMDFLRGVAELAEAIASDRRCRLDEDLAVHVTEVTEMLQYPDRFERPATVRSSFQPIEPMDWAR